MAKMSSEDKLAAVERYLTSRESSRAVAADFSISHRYLLTLTNQYQKNGVEAFVRRYTNYTKAFKLDVLGVPSEKYGFTIVKEKSSKNKSMRNVNCWAALVLNSDKL